MDAQNGHEGVVKTLLGQGEISSDKLHNGGGHRSRLPLRIDARKGENITRTGRAQSRQVE